MADTEYIGKKVKVVGADDSSPSTTIDTDNNLEQTILDSAQCGEVNNGVFDSFSAVAQTREASYELIDTMGMDATIAAALESYAEDITQANNKGYIFWAESTDGDASKYINYILKRLDLDKYAFSWAYNLVKYGDVYVRLLRESDFNNSRLFANTGNKNVLNEGILKEDVYLNVNKPGDHYAFSLETVKNPCEMFELTKFGKTMGYIQAAVDVQKDFNNNNEVSYYTTYNMKRKDVNIYSPTEFAHGCLEASTSRADEEIDMFFNDNDYKEKENAETFQVRRGAGILNDLFKVWRQLSLLENSILLNRLTRSSITRAVQMEVGDMPKSQVMNVTSRIKNLLENKSALDVGNRMEEYTNPGPMENLVVLPTRNGKGAITITQIGGDVDPKQLTDLDWFNNKLFGGLKIPKQYLGWTDDNTGFNGGTSLTIIDSRYGKTIKRCQKALIQMVTDMVNLILIDVGKTTYINKFKIMMQTPVTQEEIDRKSNFSNSLRNITDIMTSLSDIQTPSTKLKIIKSLFSEVLNDPEVISLIDSEIKKMEEEENKKDKIDNDGGDESNSPQSQSPTMEDSLSNLGLGGSDLELGNEGMESSFGSGESEEGNNTSTFEDLMNSGPNANAEATSNTTTNSEASESAVGNATGKSGSASTGGKGLPSFSDLGIDGTVNG